MSVDAGHLETAVRAALRDVESRHQPADRGAATLALTYARGIDEGGDLAKLGPPLLAALAALMMTPAARAAVLKEAKRDGSAPASPLDELRARRAQRAA